MAWTGFTSVMGPAPGDYVGNKPPMVSEDDRSQTRKLDPRVKWAKKMRTTLEAERQAVTVRMKKAQDLARGKHWTSQRAPWKAKSTLNYCQYVPQQWANILADNKPRASFTSLRRENQWQADIATAEWEDWYRREHVQRTIESAIKSSRIEGKAFLRLTFDPLARGFTGDQRLVVVPGHQVFVNRDATSLDDATVLMYLFVMSEGEILYRYDHLRGKLRSAERSDRDDAESTEQVSPPVHYTVSAGGWSLSPSGTPSGTADTHLAPYGGPTASEDDTTGSAGIVCQEFWVFPKGPDSQVEVENLVWNALNRPATRQRLLEFEDGHREPLKYVATEGGVVYELPMTAVEILKFAETLGGFKILKVIDALDPVVEKVKVPLYPNGRRMVIVGDNVAVDGCNPFSHGQLPFMELDARKDADRFFGLSDIDLIADAQEYLNRLYSLLLDAAMLTTNPVLLIPQDTDMPDEEFTNAPGAIWRVNPSFLKFAGGSSGRRAGPEMPQYVFQLLSFTIEQIRQLSGLTEIATGGKFKGQQSSETVSMYAEAAGVAFRDAIRNVEQAIERLGFQFVKNMAQFYGQPRLVRLEIAAGIDRATEFIGGALTEDMSLEAKSGSMLPTSPSARLNQIMTALQLPFPTFDLPELFEALEEFGLIHSAEKMMTRLERLSRTLPGQGAGEAWKWPFYWSQFYGQPKKKGQAGKARSARNSGRGLAK